jgi:alkanesulfonate monooxygenase SsuD/methylene tetrahydromethanopterin reductase-like flavin-dependent oxidoreductase (luciferase family)
MQIGVVFPQTEIGADAGAVRAYAQKVEELGYAHLIAYDHVVGADPAVHQGWQGPYDLHSTFHEPLVLFGYLAALTSLELVTGIIILPQRQTALVAKQGAEVDLLTGGHFRLGVGLGWNAVEYEALGKNFTDRGRRLEDQVALLRCLWTEPSVTYESPDERVTAPVSRPCPCSGPSPSGSAPPRRPPTAGPAGWPTAGFHWSRPAPTSTKPGRSSMPPPSKRAGTRAPWASKDESAGDPAARARSPIMPGAGRGSEPPTYR